MEYNQNKGKFFYVLGMIPTQVRKFITRETSTT